jgi:hypothetical protein
MVRMGISIQAGKNVSGMLALAVNGTMLRGDTDEMRRAFR